MEYEVYVLKQDVIKFIQEKINNSDFRTIEKLIDDIKIINGEYLNFDYVYAVLDVFYDDDELYDEFNEFITQFNALPKVRFVKDYSKDVVLKEDVIKSFKNFLEEEQILPNTPDYDVYMNIINSIPIAKLEV